jgi:pimeloyl-ACP methyl ester carboxylesterase
MLEGQVSVPASAQEQPLSVEQMPHADGVGHRFVLAGSLRVHLAEAGVGEPILLLHGWPQHWYMWRRLIERLAPHHRLLAPDLRGFGWTEAPGFGYDGETFARDQIALLDALEIERVKVIGHDWGGWTAILLALNYPERIERIVVLNAPHPWPELHPRLLAQAWRSWYALGLAAPRLGPWLLRRKRLAETILGHGNVGSPFSERERSTYAERFRDPARAGAVSELYRYYLRGFGEALRGRWRSEHLRVPTLLLFGERDLYISAKLIDGYQAYADDMNVELVPDSGHFIVDEKPDLVAERALAFFAST